MTVIDTTTLAIALSLFTVINGALAIAASLVIRRMDAKKIQTQTDKDNSDYALNLRNLANQLSDRNLQLETKVSILADEQERLKAAQQQLTYGIYIVFTLSDPPMVHSVEIKSIPRELAPTAVMPT